MGKQNSNTADFSEIQKLAEDAVRAFDDGYSRALKRLELYEKYIQLKRNYRVRLAERFIVIEGGACKKGRPAP